MYQNYLKYIKKFNFFFVFFKKHGNALPKMLYPHLETLKRWSKMYRTPLVYTNQFNCPIKYKKLWNSPLTTNSHPILVIVYSKMPSFSY